MKWTINQERLRVERHSDGKHADEQAALAALVEQIHGERDAIREGLRLGGLAQHEQRARRHRLIQLEERVVTARRRQRELGLDAPTAWNQEKAP